MIYIDTKDETNIWTPRIQMFQVEKIELLEDIQEMRGKKTT